MDPEGRLLLCQHGERRVARMEKDGSFTVMADRFEGKRFNSPNDLVLAKQRRALLHRSPLRHEKRRRSRTRLITAFTAATPSGTVEPHHQGHPLAQWHRPQPG
jgi:sugar lactone lactonase YvrE